MPKDAQGLNLSDNPETVRLFNQAVAEYFAWNGDPVGRLTEALAGEPDFTLGHAAIASLYGLSNFPLDFPPFLNALNAAQATAPDSDARAQAHTKAAEAWAEGKYAKAAAIWEEILLEYPTDALALRFAHDTYFYLGASQAIRDSVARVLPQWAESNPLYGYVLGMYAFGLEEAGNMAEAETAARKALALNPEDCWAAHALAHILETESRQDEGVAFLKSTRADWSKGTALSVHNGFHLGLYYLEAGNIAGLLAEYDRYIEPRLGEDAILDLVDAAALLWRVELAGGDVGERWGPITAAWFRHVDDHILAFNDMHIAFCAARSGNQHRLQVLGSLDDYQATGSGDNHAVTVSVGRQVVEAVLAFGAEDYAKTVDLLLPIRYETVKIGGSNAQRDILAQTLIAAAERLGDYRLARALLNERVALRPTDFTKRHLARVEEKLAA